MRLKFLAQSDALPTFLTQAAACRKEQDFFKSSFIYLFIYLFDVCVCLFVATGGMLQLGKQNIHLN